MFTPYKCPVLVTHEYIGSPPPPIFRYETCRKNRKRKNKIDSSVDCFLNNFLNVNITAPTLTMHPRWLRLLFFLLVFCSLLVPKIDALPNKRCECFACWIDWNVSFLIENFFFRIRPDRSHIDHLFEWKVSLVAQIDRRSGDHVSTWRKSELHDHIHDRVCSAKVYASFWRIETGLQWSSVHLRWRHCSRQSKSTSPFFVID